MSHPSRTKTQGGDRLSRNRQFSALCHNLWAGWSDFSTQKLLVRSWTGPENFIKILSFHQKLFNFLIWTDTRTHRQTGTQRDTWTPIHICRRNFLCLFLIPFTSLCLWRIIKSISWDVSLFVTFILPSLILVGKAGVCRSGALKMVLAETDKHYC